MIGVEDPLQQELREALKTSHNLGADFLITPLFAPHPPYRRANDVKSSIPLAGSDTILSTKEWATNIVGAISPWAVNQLENTSNVITTNDEKKEEEVGGEKGTEKEDAFLDRCNAEDIVMQEFSWALHIGLQAILFPFNQRTTKITNYARLLLACARQVTYQQLWITIPLLLKPNNSHDGVDNAMNGSNMDGWRTWNEIRFLTNHSHRIFVALDLNDLPPLRCISSALHKLPSSSSSSSSDGSLNNPIDFADGLWLNRWRGEPVKAVIVHTRVFVLNQKKFPVLPKPWQHLLSFFLSLSSSSGGNISGIYVMLSGQPELGQSSLAPYLDYLKHFVAAFSSSSVMLSNENEKQLINYRDVLQSPLQPLMDNLEASTYETFERDSPKYAYYQTAISKALVAMERAEREGENASLGVVKRIVLVVGAGRGPLVQCTLDASAQMGVEVYVYAVEKNPNAIITLQHRVATEDKWKSRVELVAQDMRSWQPASSSSPSFQADLIVSELLGSWADNECSPECLDGVTRFLASPHGVMIPSSYSSFLVPITASKVYMAARDMEIGKERVGRGGLQTPFVVKLHAMAQLAPCSSKLFTFYHPCPPHSRIYSTSSSSIVSEHRRYGSVSFTIDEHCTVHGFSGTFQATLFDDVELSTVPETHTPNMYSWFPLFIPLLEPLFLKPEDTLTVAVFRCKDARKVWYEWCLTSPVVTSIQNAGGSSSWIGL